MAALIPHEALTRIQLEYVEMPGLKLTPEQIGRLCGLPGDICEGALAMLSRMGFLQESADGCFRRSAGLKPRATPGRTRSAGL